MSDEYLSPLDEKLALAIERLERMSAAEPYTVAHDGWLVTYVTVGTENEPVEQELPVTKSPLLVLLNRTIKAQLLVLRSGRAWLSNFVMEEPTYPDGRKMHPDRIFLISPEGRAIEALAEAILEEDPATTTNEEGVLMGKKKEHVKVGYVCYKGYGHAVLYGDPEDWCGSKAVADIIIKPRKGYDHSGLNYPAVADDLAATVNEALTLLEKTRWDDFEASQKKEKETP